MKKTILLCFILFNSVSAFPQWRWQNPLPQGNSLASVYFTDSVTGYAVSDGGTILKTIDGALNWTIFKCGSDKNLTSVCFTDAVTGYATGGDNSGGIILKTNDAGLSWTKIFSGSNCSLNAIYLTNANTGYAVGGEGSVYKTIDAGLTWTNLSINYFYDLESVFFTDDSTGYTVGNGHGEIFKTVNGGQAWDTVWGGNDGSLYSVYFTSPDTGYVCGMWGNLWKTVNAGTTWTIDTNGLGPHSIFDDFRSIFFTDANHGYVAGWAYDSNFENVYMFRTVDAGATWTAIPNGLHTTLSSVFFPDANNGYTVGAGGAIFKSANAGNTWNQISNGNSTVDLNAIHFPDTNIGYALGLGGILKTTNGGIKWRTLTNQPEDDWFITIFFTSISTGYITNVNGEIYKTTNGGATWTKLTSGTTLQLNSVFFTDANRGFVAGGFPWDVNSGGIILKTTDAGNTWNSTIVSYPISSVYFPDSTTGYAVGTGPDYDKNGIILKTTDGGATWNQLPRKTAYALYSVFFTDPNTGYIAGDGYESYKTADGGTTWNYMQLPVYMNRALHSVYFPTPNTGYIVGEYGNIFKTNNGGINWIIDSSGTANSLSSVFFTDSITGYVAGSGGTILKKGHGGEPYLTVIPSGRIVTSNAGSTDFIVSSNTNWRVFSDSSWCTVTPSGSGNDTIIVAYPANTSTESRIDTIRVYVQQQTIIIQKVTVTQRGVNGIENIKSNTFRIYPNPATHEITITDASNLNKDYTVSIYSISGEFVRQYQCRNQHQVVIDLSDMVPGIYLIKLQTDSRIEDQKLVIQ